MSELLIKNGTVVTARDTFRADIHVVGEKIKTVAPGLRAEKLRLFGLQSGVQVIDARGCYIIPGGIDPHVHMDLPLKATSSCDNFEVGTRSALFGGTTTIIDFANQTPGDSLKSAIDLWHDKARDSSFCDYGFHVSITDFREESRREIQECVQSHGITSFKIFTAYKGSLMIDDRQIIEVMTEVRNVGGIVMVHAENGDMVDYLIKKDIAQGHKEPRYHARSRPPLAEAEAVGRAMDLATLTGCPVYLVHLSSQMAMDRALKILKKTPRGAPVYFESCPQYLLLDDSNYLREGFEGAKFVLSPPLRSKEDLRYLWKSLGKNLIQVVATDHCPFTMKQRKLGANDFSKIPNGIPGVEHHVELLYTEGVLKKRLTLQQWVRATSTAAAKIFGLYPQKGQITPGSDADLVVFNPKIKHHISSKTHHSKCDYSVYEGRPLTGKCQTVILRGKVAVEDGEFLLKKGFGRFVHRSRFSRKASSVVAQKK